MLMSSENFFYLPQLKFEFKMMKRVSFMTFVRFNHYYCTIYCGSFAFREKNSNSCGKMSSYMNIFAVAGISMLIILCRCVVEHLMFCSIVFFSFVYFNRSIMQVLSVSLVIHSMAAVALTSPPPLQSGCTQELFKLRNVNFPC